MIGGLNNRGMTLVELIFALIVASALVAIAAPALQVAIGRNSVEAEAQRLAADILFTRSEAVKRGSWVNLCQSDAASCDVENPASCRCRSGIRAKRYGLGWLIFTARDTNKDFDPKKGDILLRVGDPAQTGIVMQTNNAIQHRIGFDRTGGLDKAAGGLVAVCQDEVSTEEVPGRLISLSATGRARIDKMAPAQDCLTNQGQGQGQGKGKGK